MMVRYFDVPILRHFLVEGKAILCAGIFIKCYIIVLFAAGPNRKGVDVL